jgi:hypothetical protein
MPIAAPTSNRLRQGRAVWSSVAVALLAGCVATACGDPGTGPDALGCGDAVAAAAEAIEVEQQIDLLDQALIGCGSMAELTSALAAHTGVIGYDAAMFVELRCTRAPNDAVRSSAACRSVLAPATTLPTVSESVAFVGETLDGRQIRIVPDADTEFVGDVPAVVQQTVDIAVESGCPGVVAQRDLWAAQVGDAVLGDEASVYAQHAQRVADYIGCQLPPLAATPLPTAAP